jgi:hypothetical protein
MKDKFPDKIRLEDIGMKGDSRLFMLLERFRFYSSHGFVQVPKGTVTDGASIPRIFWNILSPFGEYFAAALPHDYLYSDRNKTFTRKQADDILLEGMVVLGVHPAKRFVIYRAVRMFGWRNYQGLKK